MPKKKRRWYNAEQRKALHALVAEMLPMEDPTPLQRDAALMEAAERAWQSIDWAALEKELEQINDDRHIARIVLNDK